MANSPKSTPESAPPRPAAGDAAGERANVDRLFDAPRRPSDFTFNRETVAVFDDMVGRSVPFYAEIQRMIQEHQRHQLTQLLKGRIKPIDLDMTDYLGLHDTLEAGFNDTEFWRSANAASKAAFIKWVMDVVRAFGMLKGLRHAFFQSEDHPEQYLLFGLGLSHLPEASEDAIRMVPYIKPFTRKGTYLLEIRRRDIGDSDAYYHELRHYTLPFLFAFDKMKEFEIRQELVSFFTTGY